MKQGDFVEKQNFLCMNACEVDNPIQNNQKIFVGDGALDVPIGSEIGARNRGARAPPPTM